MNSKIKGYIVVVVTVAYIFRWFYGQNDLNAFYGSRIDFPSNFIIN